MKTDLESEDFQLMLSGDKGIFSLDLARDMQSILADNAQLNADLTKWQEEAGMRGDKITVLIDEKIALDEKYKALKAMLAELGK